MYKFFIFFILIFIFSINSYSQYLNKPIMGGFTKCDEYEIRYKTPGSKIQASETKTQTTFYDKQGNVIKLISYENGKEVFIGLIQNTYNQKNQLIESKFLKQDNQMYQKMKYDYDANSNIIASYTFSEKNVQLSSIKFEYDKNNYLTKEVFFIREKNKDLLTNSNILINDKFGNKTKQINEQNNGSKSTVTYQYKYDSKNRVIREVRISFDNFKYIREYEYDENNNVIKTHYFDDNEKLVMTTKLIYSKE